MRSLALAAATSVLVLAAGCSSGDSSPNASSTTAGTTGSPTPTASVTGTASGGTTTGTGGGASTPSEPANVKVIAVAVSDGKVTPAPGRIKVGKGTTVRIVAITDTADRVHVHGYDKEVPTKPGSPTVIEFAATQPGLFEVETHETKKVLLTLQVQ